MKSKLTLLVVVILCCFQYAQGWENSQLDIVNNGLLDALDVSSVRHIRKFGGEIWFVSPAGNDDKDGTSPDEAFLTVGAAYSAASAGDAITIMAGDYTENITVSKDGLELWGEIGASIIGTFVLSADNCRLEQLVFQKDTGIPLTVSGLGNVIEDCKAMPATGAGMTTGVLVSGERNEFCCVISAGYTATNEGFDVTGPLNRFRDCEALGQGAATRGWYFSNLAADGNFLIDCISVNNATSSVETVSGVTDGFFLLHSGAGDGRWIDAAETNVWRIDFDNNINKYIDIAQGGAGVGWAYNLFVITGTIKINSIIGIVEVALTGSNTDVYLEIYSTNGAEDISDDNGLTIGAAVKGATLARLDKADKDLTFADPDGAPGILDEIDTKKEGFRLVEDRTGGAHVATYLRFIHTTGGASTGEIDWYVDWEPVSDDGWLAPAP